MIKSLRRNKALKKSNSLKEKKGSVRNLVSEDEFVRQYQDKGIKIKSSLIEYAALSRDLNVTRLSNRLIIVQTSSGNELPFIHLNGKLSSRVGMTLCDTKQDARFLLKQNGMSVVDSEVFTYNNFEKAAEYVKRLGYPVVVKPTNLSRGKGITTNINTLDELKKAWDKALNAYRKGNKSNNILVEKFIIGEDFRMYVVGDKVVSAAQRKRANVVGNGDSTVLELIKEKNKERGKNPYLSAYLIPQELNELDRLIKSNKGLDYVPDKEEEVILRGQSNLSAGGDSIDFTDTAHPEFKKIAINAIKAIPGIDYAGVDFITKDITIKPIKSNHIVSEIEYSPAPFSHFPSIGKKRDQAGALLEYYLNKYK